MNNNKTWTAWLIPLVSLCACSTLAPQASPSPIVSCMAMPSGGTEVDSDTWFSGDAVKKRDRSLSPKGDGYNYGYDKPPVLIRAKAPAYPETQLKARESGDVMLQVTIDEEGKVEKAIPCDSTNPYFAGPTVYAVQHYFSFKPATKDGKPVKSVIFIPFKFRSEDARKPDAK